MLTKKRFLFFIFVYCFIIIIPDSTWGITAKDKYLNAERCYKKLRHNPKKQKYRCNWTVCIDKFYAVYKHAPSGPWAAAGMYMSGVLYTELYKHSYALSDKKKAIKTFKRVIKKFSKSQYKKKAITKLSEIGQQKKNTRSEKKIKKKLLSKKKPDKSRKKISDKLKKKQPNKISAITDLRFWSNPSYTRIVIDGDVETDYKHRLLKQDPAINKPKRLYVDLSNSILSKNIDKTISINDNLLTNIRIAQHKSDSVRIVMDIKSLKTYKIFSLKNPFRIVIDVLGQNAKSSVLTTSKKDLKLTGKSLARQLALGVKLIVIDPGHGGRDYGAPGYLKGVHEKDIVLVLAKKLAKKIREQLHCKVILTRTIDKYLTLEERTAIANTKNADLFISIHTNAAWNRNAYGIETYFLNLATDDSAIMVAARENATSAKNISDLETILTDLMQNAKINESSRLATNVQQAVVKKMKNKYSKIKSKGVKQAPFYVLLGAQMPSILIETSFISNPRECKRLIDSKYQNRFCDGVIAGIKTYIKAINPSYSLAR